MKSVPVIDLFAGPGGLGEGFSSLHEASIPSFKIVLSIEKETNAHSTLELRSFFRQFRCDNVPEEYYRFLRQEISKDDLYERYPNESAKAQSEAKLATLGKVDEKVLDNWISDALGDANKEWVLIGGPPCQAYSLAGRSRNKGISGYKPEEDDRHYLYKEYLRIIAKHWPSVFVMENVMGILSSQVEGKRVFENIFNDLVNPGSATGSHEKYLYKIYSLVESSGSDLGVCNKFTIKSEEFGIPQARHRVILLGVRDSNEFDGLKPGILRQLGERITTWDVISNMPRIRSGLSSDKTEKTWYEAMLDIRDSDWYNELPQNEMNHISDKLDILLSEASSIPELGTQFTEIKKAIPSKLGEWFLDNNLLGVCNHVTRNQMHGDLHRYFYSACYAEIYGKSAKLNDLPPQLLPAHKNVKEAVKSRNLFSDRFRVQLPDRPSTTITSHIAKDGHYYIHPDPVQCRSLSVREAARLQTFPDNYFFCGSRTAQYTQVGNAVPPLLALKISQIVSSLLSKSRRNHGR